ncbi:MAG: coenzyme F430 synthase [Methanomassiliicoccales archaeon]
MKVLILDQTHGGDKIGREYLRNGDDVTVVDVYGTMKPKDVQLSRDAGMRCTIRTPSEHFDLAIVPVHCPDRFLAGASFDERITHHEAVGRLVRFQMPVIEVTGAGGKTSTCFVLAHVLSSLGKKVLLHTSRGIFGYARRVTTIKEGTSIAPASLIDLSRIEGYDFAVIEESLGGCGVGDVCCVTTIGDNYDIAGMTRKAFDGKVQMITLAKRSVVFPEAEMDLWAPHVRKGVDITSFGANGDVSVSIATGQELGVPMVIGIRSAEGTGQITMPGTYLVPSYRTAFEASIAIVSALKLDVSKAITSLANFNGVPGRGEIEREGDWYFIRERNPGVSARSIEWNLSMLETMYNIDDIGLVIDPMNVRICEKLDVEAIMKVVSEHPSVRQTYLFERDAADADHWADLVHIKSVYDDIWANHQVVLWCTKEGFQ